MMPIKFNCICLQLCSSREMVYDSMRLHVDLLVLRMCLRGPLNNNYIDTRPIKYTVKVWFKLSLPIIVFAAICNCLFVC